MEQQQQQQEAGEGGQGGAPKGGARFWDSVCLLLRQFDGMVDGYQVRGGWWLPSALSPISLVVILKRVIKWVLCWQLL